MKKILLLLVILYSNIVFAYDLKKVDFTTFLNYVSYHLNKNIVVADDVPKNFSVFMPENIMSKTEIKKSLIYILRANHLKLKTYGNTYYIYIPNPPVQSDFLIRFNFIPKSVIINYINKFYPGLKFQVFQNRLFIHTTYDNYVYIKHFITSLQSSYKQSKVNFLIVVINNKKAKQLGANLNIKSPFHKRILFDLITDTASVTTSLPSGIDFKSFIRFLNKKNIAQTISKPTINLIDSFNYTLESVHNIPYVTKTVSVDKDGNPVTRTNLQYKDVGLKVYVKNVSITKRSIDFDLDIFIDNLLSMTNNIPLIDTKHFNTHIQLTKNKSHYLIAGLRSVTTIDNKSNVPGLSKIPVFGWLFKTKNKNIEDLSFSFYISTNFFENIRSEFATTEDGRLRPPAGGSK
ncbi:conserved hypothetical protein [Lebetimonas natsushimae]|uniref:Type II/III secretion system secretin-like domain-containing protein n=1 Tax=Lebetimonas natsushimae TaxID=1936991 RepID=A0A292Y907_9BACT|nr:type II secretion pathway protein XcpQ [Lebetimonas natsushimae]GAX87352.1 conserved hypothetical protein [Lebetimonas natsushimae]